MDPERHSILEVVSLRYLAALAVALVATVVMVVSLELRQGTTSKPKQDLLQRPERASSILQPFAVGQARKKARRARSGIVSCLRPGPTNTVANCKSVGLPAVEPSVAANDSLVVASAADYNSYNGMPQLGFYWSTDGRRWWTPTWKSAWARSSASSVLTARARRRCYAA